MGINLQKVNIIEQLYLIKRQQNKQIIVILFIQWSIPTCVTIQISIQSGWVLGHIMNFGFTNIENWLNKMITI